MLASPSRGDRALEANRDLEIELMTSERRGKETLRVQWSLDYTIPRLHWNQLHVPFVGFFYEMLESIGTACERAQPSRFGSLADLLGYCLLLSWDND